MLAEFDALPKPAVFKLSTAPVLRVLEKLGRPQDRLPPVIHIAGTNGKGSTTAFMRAIAEAHGLKVHVDTSPHLIRVNERIRVAGELISDADLRRHVRAVLDANAGEPLSFFEGMTIASFLAFAETPADLTLVEVGLGGRFDSTNVFDKPAASVITPIAFDHKDLLGHNLCQIAWEKAGVIKAGCPVISAEQDREIERTLRAEATYRGAPFTKLSDVMRMEKDPYATLTFQTNGLFVDKIKTGLMGKHQCQNAALAVQALSTAGVFKLQPDMVRTGLANASWPARLQILKPGPLVTASGNKTVILDGGHNPHAASAICTALKERAPVPIICAMLGTKDSESFMREIAPIAERLIAIPLPGAKKSQTPETLVKAASKYGIPAETSSDLDQAVEIAKSSKQKTLLICGSLYLAGDVLKANGEVIT